jgi:hypothetical protein
MNKKLLLVFFQFLFLDYAGSILLLMRPAKPVIGVLMKTAAMLPATPRAISITAC